MIRGLRFGPRIPLGNYGVWPLRRKLSFSLDEIKTHAHIIGKSGGGKSRALASLYLNLLRAGLSATLIDPHTDLSRLVLRQLVADGVYRDPAAFERIIYLDLSGMARKGYFLPLNVLNQPYDRHTTCRNLLEALTRAWPALGEGRAPQFENIVLAGSYSLLCNRLPFTLLHELLVNKDWRDQLLTQVDDPQIVGFFHERYDKWARDQATMIESTLRRVFLLSFTPILRNMLGQWESALPIRTLMDRGQSVIINLGGLDEETQKLLGCLLMVGYEKDALSRENVSEDARLRSHHIIVDEWSLFAASSEEALNHMLSGVRKYGVFVWMCHQTFSQTSVRSQGALQNVGIRQAFKLGRSDAEYAAAIFGRPALERIRHEIKDPQAAERGHPNFMPLSDQWEEWIQTLQDLKHRQALVLDPRDRVTKIRTLPMPDPVVNPDAVAEVEEHYLKRYFRPADQIQRELDALRPQPEEPPKSTRFQRLDS